VRLFALLAGLSATLAAIALVLVFYSPSPQGVSGQIEMPSHYVSGLSFDKATNLTNNTQDSVYGQVVAEENNVYVVWQDSVSSESGEGRYVGRNYDIFMIKSMDAGDSFGDSVNLSVNSGFSEHPQASVSSGSLHVVWADDSSGNREVLFSTSTDGSNFTTPANLSNTASDSFNPEIASSGDNVYVVWLEEGETSSRVLLKASQDGGNTFGDMVVISDKANIGTLPKVASHGDGVHVAWSLLDDENENGLFYSKSADGGITFGEPAKLSDENNFGEPQVVASDDSVYVVSGGLDVIEVNGLLVAKSTDGGENFSTEMINVNGSFVNPLNVEAYLVNGSTLYVAGQVFASSNEEILLLPLDVRSAAAVPTGLVNLSQNPKISECPSIAISGDRIFVVWEDLSPGNHEILYAKGKMISAPTA
jgi:hypothetical protein